MPNAQSLRLRDALREFVQSYNGDTGTRRSGGTRSQIPDSDKGLVDAATVLLQQVEGHGDGGDGTQRQTPGSRARDRASTGVQGQTWGRDVAKALLNGQPGAADGTQLPVNNGGNQ